MTRRIKYAEAIQLARRQAVAGEHQATGERLAEMLAFSMAAPPARPTSISGMPKDRVSDGHHDVAGRHQAEAGAERRAVHRRDHRLGAFLDGVAGLARDPVVLPVLAVLGRIRALLQIGAGAEDLALGGQHHDTDVVAVGRLVEDLGSGGHASPQFTAFTGGRFSVATAM